MLVAVQLTGLGLFISIKPVLSDHISLFPWKDTGERLDCTVIKISTVFLLY